MDETIRDIDLVVRVTKHSMEDSKENSFSYDVFEGDAWKRFKTPEDSITYGGLFSSGEDDLDTEEEARQSAIDFINRMRKGTVICKTVEDS